MRRCQRCTFWRSLGTGLDAGWGVCGRVATPDRPSNARFSAVVVDGLLETAELYTHETFSCDEWSPRLKRVIHSDIVYEEAK